MSKKTIALVVSGCLIASMSPGSVLAHGGGLDRFGCHTVSATGEYHCHDRDERDIDWALVGGVLGGLIVLGIVISLASSDNDPAALTARLQAVEESPFRIIFHFSEHAGAGLDLEYDLSESSRIGLRSRLDAPTLDNPEQRQDHDYVGVFYQLRF